MVYILKKLQGATMKQMIEGLAVYTQGDSAHQGIVFLHGFPYDHTLWNPLIKGLCKEYYCVSYDIRGLGASSIQDGQYTIEGFVNDLEMVMKKLGLKKPIVCGFSMGGYIVLRALERMQERFGGVILCDSVAQPDSNEGKIKRSKTIQSIDKEGLKPFVETFVNNCFMPWYKQKHPEVIESWIKKASNFSAKGVKGCLLAMMGRNDMQASLASITLPALVICGKEDTITPINVVEAMAKAMPKAHFVSIEKCGHMSVVEDAPKAIEAIDAFLKGIKK